MMQAPLVGSMAAPMPMQTMAAPMPMPMTTAMPQQFQQVQQVPMTTVQAMPQQVINQVQVQEVAVPQIQTVERIVEMPQMPMMDAPMPMQTMAAPMPMQTMAAPMPMPMTTAMPQQFQQVQQVPMTTVQAMP